MKLKNSVLLRTIIVAGLVSLIGYVGLDIPRDTVEEVVDEQLERFTETEAVQSGEVAEVLRVIDGDTAVVSMAGKEETVRFIGIDAPETEFSPRGGECYGSESSDYVSDLLTGKQVRLQTDGSQASVDDYGRLLRYVVLDGVDVGELIIQNGFAEEFTFKNSYQNQDLYKEAENRAKVSGAGLWSECI